MIAEDLTCPLCRSPMTILINQTGIHCEGLQCKSCGCNARNRFFYHVIKTTLRELQNGIHTLSVLEASSFGFVALGQNYIDAMEEIGVKITCSDFFERNFKAKSHEDLTDLSFEDKSLDMICHSHVLEHVDDDILAMHESYRCLRPGGKLLVAVPVQTDFTFHVRNEYHGDNSYVYRRNGWDIIRKLKDAGFHVEVRVPPEHVAINPLNNISDHQQVLDDVRFGDKFGVNFQKYRELFYPACSKQVSEAQRFGDIWPQLEAFLATKPAI